MSALLDSLREQFATLPAVRVDAADLGARRRDAMFATLAEGLPGPRSERWKYTPLRALAARRFSSADSGAIMHPSLPDNLPGPRLVFVNGLLASALSDLENLPPGLSLRPLSQLLAQGGEPMPCMLFDDAFAAPDEAFARLNTALATEGVLLQVAPGATIDTVVHLVFLGSPADGDIATHSRHLIEVGAGASLRVVEHHLASGAQRHLSNHLTQVVLHEGAVLVHARLQDEDAGATLLARTDATLATATFYHRIDLELGAGLSRNEFNCVLSGEGARLRSGGALLAGARRHVDTRLGISHAARDTQCQLLWRGLAADRGRLVFHGGINIESGADGSDASLSNKNLLLSDNAEIDSQPVLQIHADEVKAAHGATVGRLDEQALFYLRSRGIPLMHARSMLTLAFCREALAFIGDAQLIELLSPRLEARLAILEAAA